MLPFLARQFVEHYFSFRLFFAFPKYFFCENHFEKMFRARVFREPLLALFPVTVEMLECMYNNWMARNANTVKLNNKA
jgi:hypothetical protein